MLKIFQQLGRDLFISGLISSHGGNMSIIDGERVHITRSGSMLGRLIDGDVVVTGLNVDDGDFKLASSELVVHRAVYRHTDARAILHAHPPYAVALSLLTDEDIVPVDSEGAYLLKRVPVISAKETIGSQEVAEKLPQALSRAPISVLKGHGSFAVGSTLAEALQYTTALELAAKIIWLSSRHGGRR
ncbi:aldolase [Metallumcola ferriviriculae]|uniref:Aldolase n=1 Tax=Metallumcola ferriviriculae TaxID=3039180 RepID=A0AAU0UKV3_9FIRM|nr:aldolase [Desulfitibacteraceae bacterium MK1]